MSKSTASKSAAAPSTDDRPAFGGTTNKVSFGVGGLKELGAVGLGKAPEFFADEVVLANDPRHPDFEAHNPARYTMDYRDEHGVAVNKRDFASIRDNGMWQWPLLAPHTTADGEKVVIAVEGSRRLWLQVQIDLAAIAAGGRRTPINVNLQEGMTLEQIHVAHAGANEGKVADDWMTRARKMRILHRGIPKFDAAGKIIDGEWEMAPMSFVDIGTMFGVAESTVEKILDPKRGLFALSPRCQAALGDNKITQSNALHFAKVADHGAQDAMLDKARKGLTEDETPDRNTTRALARETKKGGGTADAVPEGKEGKDGETRLPKDFRPTRKVLEGLKANLKALNPSDDLGPLDVALCLAEYLLDRSVDCIDRLPPKLQEAITKAIPLA